MSYRSSLCAALVVSLMVPVAANAQTAPIQPVLSTTMQRSCVQEVKVLMQMDRGEVFSEPQLTTEQTNANLRVSRTATRWVFNLTSSTPDGGTDLTFETTLDGARVTSARSSDPELNALPGFNLALADDVPERLLVGRTFRIGDPLYPEGIASTLLDRLLSATDMSFDVTSVFDIRYVGETTFRGRRTWRFAGPIEAQATTDVLGARLEMDIDSQGETLIDVATGLVLASTVTETTFAEINGAPFRRQTKTTVMTCDISPQ